MQRVMVYVDGFNLYFGLKSKGWKRYCWLDLRRLSENLLQADQALAGVRYFTARISARPGNPDKPKRQATFLEALETLPDLHIHYGHYLAKQRKCFNCGATWDTHEEKMTDVNIAVELLEAGGESSAAELAARLGAKAEAARELCYRLYNTVRAQEACRRGAFLQRSGSELARNHAPGACQRGRVGRTDAD